MVTAQDCAGVILAGGRATRMGGGDKGLLLLHGRPLLAHVIARLRPQVAALALNANGNPDRFAAFGLPVLADPVPDHPGPLAGGLAAMDWAAGLGCDRVLTTAADTPFLPPDLCAHLAAAGPFALAAGRGPDGAVHLHPTIGLWPVGLRDRLRAALIRGERRVGRWAQEQGAVPAVFPAKPGADPFLNINTPQDLAAAQAFRA